MGVQRILSRSRRRTSIIAAAIAALGARPAAAQLVTADLSGSIEANFSSGTDGSGNTTYSFINASATLDLNVPTIPVAAVNSGYWSDPLVWNGAPILLVNDGVTIYGVFSDVVGAVLDFPNEVNSLVNSGPTEQSIGIPGFSLESSLGLNASFGAYANLTYDVTVPTGIQIVMDQPTVIVQSLAIQQGATLTGNGGFTVRTDLSNKGTLYNVGGTIQGNFLNITCGSQAAYANITAPLTVQGSLFNTGTVSIESGASLSVAQPTSNNGTLIQYGGAINVPGALTNNASFQSFGGTIPSINNSTNGIITIVSNNASPVRIWGGTLNNGGAINWSGGPIEVDTSAVINNLAGGVIDATDDQAMYWTYNGQPTLNNAGLFEKTGGTGTTTLSNIIFNNTGTIAVLTGTIDLGSNATLNDGTLITGPGSISGNSVALNGNVTFQNITFTGGNLGAGGTGGYRRYMELDRRPVGRCGDDDGFRIDGEHRE
jgi:hypothetical protein